jgi:hypothetical protein
MPAIKYQLNKRNVVLENGPGNQVPVLMRSGERKWQRWLGFIDVEVARRLPGASAVKLDVTAASTETPFMGKWIYLRETEGVQGCRIGEGVFGVTESTMPKVVPRVTRRVEGGY